MAQLYKKMSPEKALEKAKWYCSFQERCKQQVINRLIAWKVDKIYFNQLIEALENDDFLNEKRFAAAFVRGKFLMKNWGRIKITNQLYQLGINENEIKQALATEIDETDYLKTLHNLTDKKKRLLSGVDKEKQRGNLFRYLTSKGFETELIVKVLGDL